MQSRRPKRRRGPRRASRPRRRGQRLLSGDARRANLHGWGRDMLDRRELVVEGGRLAWTRRPPDVKPPARATATSSRYRRPTAVLGGEPSVASVSATARAVGVADSAKIASSSSNWPTRATTSRSVIGGGKTRVQPALVLIELDLFRRSDTGRGRRPPPRRALGRSAPSRRNHRCEPSA